MPKFVSKELPEGLYARLSGHEVERYLDKVILLYTVDANGWPHPSLLSYFEVAAKDRSNLRLATYMNSNTTENMRRNGKVTLSVFDERVAYSIKGKAEEIRREMQSVPRNSLLNVAVDQVLVDEADPVLEPGAYIASGVTCVNPNPGRERTWRNDVLKELID
ncbi:MAG TPA: pyridoxamine 5'-phosphate oxidase family protein [Terriglobia bacterium]|nr:pyridoxamine 5'-phosphate oxidase family protein [Terriglobia bacterium]